MLDEGVFAVKNTLSSAFHADDEEGDFLIAKDEANISFDGKPDVETRYVEIPQFCKI
jgi:hypothetical protein